jgi:hypothetical protein
VIKAQSGCSSCADAVKFTPVAHGEVDYVAIEGPYEVKENTSAQYTLRAYYSNGHQQVVSADSWEVSCPAFAEISQTGLLTAKAVDADETCTIEALLNDGDLVFMDTIGSYDQKRC